jgi:GMP synthase (glutamine-hydrolysing)
VGASAQKTVSLEGADESVRLWDNSTAQHSNYESRDEIFYKKRAFMQTSSCELYIFKAAEGKKAVKSHHNVGGLPIELVRELGFDETPIEPLRMLFKDEVRRVGLELGVPRELVYRQPFPGPGLAVRIVGEITPYKAEIVRDADYIFREELHKAGVDENLGQYFAALSNMHSVGVMGDHRTYGLAVVLRAVITSDFMTAEAAEIPWNVLQTTMNRIINEVEGVNRVLYDITSKPPGTIELE